jgi:ubiquinone/menaquinone biosynthesis C-methylase UbiE
MEPLRPQAAFTDVDRTADPQACVRWLDRQHALVFKQQYKARTFALLDLQPGHRVLDVGCGTGQDALALAERVVPGGEVIGLDYSRAMIEEARRRGREARVPATFVRGDAHRLGFADDTFDRCRADRTFQHLADPEQALTEMIRVTKPGGRLLIVEPDHETLVIDTPYKEVTRRFLAFRADGLRQGDIAHRLFALFRAHGLVEIGVEPLTEIATDYAAINGVMGFDRGIRTAAECGVVSRDEAERWIAYVEEAASTGRFLYAMTFFITTGRRPE